MLHSANGAPRRSSSSVPILSAHKSRPNGTNRQTHLPKRDEPPNAERDEPPNEPPNPSSRTGLHEPPNGTNRRTGRPIGAQVPPERDEPPKPIFPNTDLEWSSPPPSPDDGCPSANASSSHRRDATPLSIARWVSRCPTSLLSKIH